MFKQKRVVWAYMGLVNKHPFINLAADTLRQLGHVVTIYSRENVILFPGIWRLQGTRLHSFYRAWKRIHRVLMERAWGLFVLPKIILARPDIIICTMPQALLAGWMVKKLLRSRLVYYPFELYGEQAFRSNERWAKLERWLLENRSLNALITQNEKRADVYKRDRKSSIEPYIVHNYKSRSDIHTTGKLHTILNLPDDVRIILYEGIFMPGRWLDRLVRAVTLLPQNIRLVMMGKKLPWWVENIAPLVADPEISGKVIHTPYVPQDELLEYVADADVGVIIYDDSTLNNLFCEPGKLSDYVIAGVPVLAPDFPTIGPIIRQYRIGETFSNGSPEAIAEGIQKLLAKPRESWREGLETARRDLVWETQVDTFVQAVFGETQ